VIEFRDAVTARNGGEPETVCTSFREAWNLSGHPEIGCSARSAKMKLTWKQLFGLSVAAVLFGGGVWANVVDGSLHQNKGAWVSHAVK